MNSETCGFIGAVAFAIFCLLDALAYHKAKWPQRTKGVFHMFPGSGFVALYRFGRDKQ
jgi:hypothetical protein